MNFQLLYSSYGGFTKEIWKGILLSFLEALLVGIAVFLSLYFVQELHFSIIQASTIMSFYGLGTIAGGLIGGKLSDKISPEIVSTFSLILQSLTYLALIKIHSPTILMLDLFLIGVGSYGFITSNYIWVLARCKIDVQQRSKAINILNVASNLGLGLSSLIISILSTQSFHTLFLISSFFLFLAAIYLNFQEKTAPLSNLPLSYSNLKKVYLHTFKISCINLSCLFVVGVIISQTNSNYSIYLQTIFPEMGLKSFGILFTINTCMVVTLQSPLGNLFNNYNKILVMGIGAFLLGFGMFLLVYTYSFSIAILSMIIATLGEILFFSVSQLICYENAPENKKGQNLGIYRMVYASSRVVGPISGGFIFQSMGGNQLWYFCGMLGLLCFLPTVYFRKLDQA